MNTGKRLLSALLCACMIAVLLPTAAFAAGTDTGKAIQIVDSGTAAVGGKPEGELQAVGDYSGNEWKLTLYDSDRSSFVASKADDHTITYSGAKTGGNEYISILIQDDNTQEYTHYSKLKHLTNSSDTSGNIEVILPFDMTDKTLYVFNEQCNGGKMTDYASKLQTVEMERNAYAIKNNLTNITTSNSATYRMITDNTPYTATLTPDSSHVLPDSITVTIGGSTLTAGTDYIYNSDNGNLSINNITGDIEITAEGEPADPRIEVSPSTHTFAAMEFGDTTLPTKTFTITNKGNVEITVTLPDGMTHYTITGGEEFNDNKQAVLAVGTGNNSRASFTIQPNTGLSAGTYEETVTICGSHGVTEQIYLSFTVNQSQLPIPANPSWDSTTPGKAVWDKVENASGYTVQLYKNGAVEGLPVSVTDTAHQFNITGAGTYTFKVLAVGTGNYSDSFDTESGNLTFYTVSFDADGGSPAPEAQCVLSSSKAEKPKDPSKDNHIFLGWYNGDTLWNFDNEITESITLTAKWEKEPVSYPVTVNNGTGGGPHAAGDTVTITANAPAAGQKFSHWTVEQGGVTLSNPNSSTTTFTMPAGAVTVTANFKDTSGGGTSRPTYRPDVEDTVNGEVTVRPSTPHKGDKVTVTPKPKDGYEVEDVIVTGKDGKPVDVTDNGDGTWTFIQPGSKVTVEAIFREIPPEPLPFTDVLESAWYYEAVRYVHEHGLMNGTAPALFSPEGTTTRGQIVTILWRMAGSPGMEEEIWGYPFADVDATAYYGTAVYWARLNDIAGGYGDGTFGPNTPITREQFAAMLYRFAQEQDYDVSAAADLSGYADTEQISAYALAALQWANAEGIINGTSDTTLTPQGQTTRAQAAVMLMRFCERYTQ